MTWFGRVGIRAALLAMLVGMAVTPAQAQNRAAFEVELTRLAQQLGVPSLSAAVVEGGAVVWVRHVGTTARRGDPVRYAVGGLTQSFTAALALTLKKVALDAPVDLGGGRSATLQHVLSHTAIGTPGARFVHSARVVDRAGPVLARAAGSPSLGAALTSRVLRPLALSHTSAASAVTASDGIESTVEDIAKLTIGLESGKLVPRVLASTMFQPGRDAGGRLHPYGLGWFVQPISGQQIRWQAGSEPDGSSLVLTVPGRRLTLVVLARGGRLNAPFWLSFGDIRWSPVATAFLSQWAGLKLELPEGRRVMTDALVALASGRAAEGTKLADKAASLAPGLLNAPDATLLAAFARSGQASLREMGETVARRLLAVDADHPRTLLDLAVLRIAAGKTDEGRGLLEKVLKAGQAPPEIMDEAATVGRPKG